MQLQDCGLQVPSGSDEPPPALVPSVPPVPGGDVAVGTSHQTPSMAGSPVPPWMWWCCPQARAALTGLYSGSHSGMLRLLISEAIFFLCPGLVTPMAVRSWSRERGQSDLAPDMSPSLQHQPALASPRSHLWSHPANGGDVVAGVDEVGCVELQLELAEPLVHSL